MIVGLLAVTVAMVYAGAAREAPYYQATVQIMPSDAALYRSILPAPVLSPSAPSGRRHKSELPNLMSLIKSRQVAERAIPIAGLECEPENLQARIHVTTATNPGARSIRDAGTDIIEIRVRDVEPERAVGTANAIAHVFSNYYQEISHQEAADSRRFLESELFNARLGLQRAAEKLRNFKRQHNITSLSDMTASAMATLKQSLAERDSSQAALAEAGAKLTEINKQLDGEVGPTRRIREGTTNSPMVQALEGELAQVTQQLNDARAKYQDEHPKVIVLKGKLDEVDRKLEQERTKMKTTVSEVRNPVYEVLLQEKARLAYERDGLAAKVRKLNEAVRRSSGSLKPGMDVALVRLENEFQTAQTAYNNLEIQLNQARINEKETSTTGAIRIVDTAERAAGPMGSNKWAYLALGAIMSLIVGVGFAITLDSLDNRIKTDADVERLLALPVTALIPKCSESSNSDLPRLSHIDPLSPVSEAYRFLRTDLLLSAAATGAKSIMVATAKPGQGGTTTVANLAISLAIDGKRVILVDADMRRPSLHRIFKAQNDFGLSSVLSNEKDFEDVIVGTETDNLLLLPAGPTPSNSSELLGSARMRALVGALTEHADYVLFDTPSAIAFTDSVVLSQLVDGVILVVRAQQVPRGAELQVRDVLNKANANILGVVLTDVQPEMVDSYYYHSHYYPVTKGRRRDLLQGAAAQRTLPPKGD